MIELLWSIFDITLVLLLLALAWNTCSTRDVMRAVTLFIAMGLLLAIIWARLKAPVLALAEAVIGAGGGSGTARSPSASSRPGPSLPDDS